MRKSFVKRFIAMLASTAMMVCAAGGSFPVANISWATEETSDVNEILNDSNEVDSPVLIEGEEVQEGNLNGLKYIYNSDKVVITGCDDTVTEITIPKEIGGKTVSNIATKAFYNNSKLTMVKIEAEITEIPEKCFAYCIQLKDVIMPDCIEKIGNASFIACMGLDKVVLPSNLTEIGENAFEECYKLDIEEFPEELTFIGNGAFTFCKSLKKVSLPENVKKIGYGSFRCCSTLQSIEISGNVKKIELMTFENCTELKNVVLMEGITTIYSKAFNGCSALGRVEIPESVIGIANDAFKSCPNLVLSGITGGYAEKYAELNGIPFNVETYNGKYNGLKYVIFGEQLVITGCDETRTEITIPTEVNGKSVTNIAESAFYNTEITTLKIEAEITEIPDKCFAYCSQLKNVIMPDSIERIGESSFKSCTKLEEMILPSNLKEIGENAFEECYKLDIEEFPEKLTFIGNSAFAFCKSLKKVMLPENVETIGCGSFRCCSTLQSIEISGNVKKIELMTFENCPELKNVVLMEGITTIYSKAFNGCDALERVKIPESVIGIANDAFNSCPNLVLSGITGGYAEKYAELNGIPFNIETYNGKYNGLKYVMYGEQLVITGCDGTRTEITIPTEVNGKSVTNIAESAFYNTEITTLKIEAEITEIPDKCFAYCSQLKNVIIPNSIERIGESSFKSCTKLEEMILPSNLKEIGENAFGECYKLDIEKFPEKLTYIGNSAFAFCKSLKKVMLPENVETIGCGSFRGCSTLQSVEISGNVKKIELMTFENCSTLENVVLMEGITTIGSKAFSECSSLKRISLPNSLVGVASNAFHNCISIEKIKLSDKITEIRSLIFSNCTKLYSLYIPETVTSIADDAFENCYFLYISSPKDSEAIEFAKNNNIHYIEISEDKETGEFDAEISGDVIDKTEDGQEIPIVSGSGSAIFDADSVIQIKYNHGNSDVVFNYNIVDKNKVEGEFNGNLSDYDVLMNFDFLDSDGNKVEFSSEDDGGTVTITVPYKAPVKANKISVYYIKPDGTKVDMNGVYNPSEKTITFTTTHFSYYAIECLDEFGSTVTRDEMLSSEDHSYNSYGYCKDCGSIENGTDAFVSANAVVGGKIAMNFKVALSAEAAADPEARMKFNLESGKVISIPISNASLIDSEKNIYQFTLSVTSTQMDEKVTAQMKYSEGFTYPYGKHSSVLADYSVNKYLSNLEEDARADNNTKLLDVISAMKNFGVYMDIYSGDTTSDFTPDDLSGEQITIEKFYNSRVDRSISGLTAKSASVTVGSLIDISINYEITDDISKYTFRLDGRKVQPVLKNGMYCVTIPEISPRNYSRVYIVSVTDGQRTLSVEYSVLSYIKNKLNDSDVNLVNVCRAMYLYNEAITAYSSKDAGGPYNVYFGVDGIMEADLDENRIYYETDYWVKDRGGLSSYFNKETLEALQQKTVAELSDKTQLNGKEFYIEKNGPYSDGPDTLFTCGRITLAYPKKFGKLNSITFGPFDYDDVARGEITVDGTDYYVYCIRGATLSLYAGTFRINLSSD